VLTLKGVAVLEENEVVTNMTPETKPMTTVERLGNAVEECLQQYFAQLDGQNPSNLYSLVLAEIEKPLIAMVLKLTNGNQSKAAKMLGISRGTLRKKMAMYKLH
jgi:DNA-binding protein Fis